MKWSNNSYLQKIFKLNESILNLKDAFEENRKTLLFDQIIKIILAQICYVNEQIFESQYKNQPIPSISIGIINNICSSFIFILEANDNISNDIIISGFILQLKFLYHHLPLYQFKSIHIKPLEILANSISAKSNQFFYQIGIIHSLARLFEYPSSILVESVQITIFHLVNSGNVIIFDSSEGVLNIPIQQKHFLIYELQSNGTLDIFLKIISLDKINDNKFEIMHQILIIIYKEQQMPSYLLDLNFDWLNEYIERNLETFHENKFVLQTLQYFSFHKNNHESILVSNILSTLISNINGFNISYKIQIIQILQTIYIQGVENTRNLIKLLIPNQILQNLIIRKNYIHSFYYDDENDEDNETIQINAVRQFDLNRYIFALNALYTEEEKCNIISNAKTNIEQSLKIEDLKVNYQNDNFNNKINNNIWEYIENMIYIAENLKDTGIFQGAMIFIRQSVYLILFEQVQKNNWPSLNQSIDSFQLILNNENLQITFNLIDIQICSVLNFILKESKQNKQLSLQQSITSLIASFSEQGFRMSRIKKQNPFLQVFIESKPLMSMQQCLDNKIEEDQNDEDIDYIKYIKENMKLNAAIALCCIKKNNVIKLKTLKQCQEIIIPQLNYFIKLVKKESSENNSIINSLVKKQSQIYNNEIKFVQFIIISVQSIGIYQGNMDSLVDDYKILEFILRFIHLNCKGFQNKNIPNIPSIQNLVSSTFKTLSQYIENLSLSKINNLNIQHNHLAHISSTLSLNFDQQSKESKSFLPYYSQNSLSKGENYQFRTTYSSLISSSLILLSQLMKYSDDLTTQVIMQPTLISQIIQIAENLGKNNQKSEESSIILQSSLSIIKTISKIDKKNVFYQLIHKQKVMKLLQNLMSSAGGQVVDDDILTSCIKTFSKLLKNIHQIRKEEQSQKLLNQIKVNIEEYVLLEEKDSLLFHSDFSDSGVQSKAKKLKNEIYF